MSIIDESIIQDFKGYSFWVEATLRDYEYNEDLVENIGKLKRILQIMCEKYAGHKVIDKYIVREIVYFPRAVLNCKYNIKDKQQEIENVASDFRKALSTILDGTWDFVNEKEEIDLGEQYQRILEVEVECWENSLGKCGFVTAYNMSKKFDFVRCNIFLNMLKELVELSNKIGYYSKNAVRILCGVYEFYCELYDELDTLGEIEGEDELDTLGEINGLYSKFLDIVVIV